MILQGSATEQLSTQVWEVFLKAAFSDVLLSGAAEHDGADATSANNSSRKIKCVDMRLSTAQVKELLDWLSSYFMHTRMSDKHLSSFGLLAKWGRYVSHVSFLIGSLLRGYVVKVVNGAGDMNPYHVIELVWQPLVAVFSPWLQTLATGPDVFQSAWLEADDTLAIIILQVFRDAVLFIYDEMNKVWPDSGSGVLAMALMYYLTCVATKSTADNVASLFNSELGKLPWRFLKPDLQLLETMTRVREAASPACFSLVSVVMLQVDWFVLLDNYRRHWPPELASRAEISLAVLLVQGHVHPLYGQSEEFCRLLNEAITYEWSLVTQEGFTCICNWFLQLCNPRCVLSERSSSLALGLRLLKRIAEFHSDTAWSSTVLTKRQLYVHCFVQQMCQLTYESGGGGVSEEQLSTVLVNFLSEIETVESSVTSAEAQQGESVLLVKEVLSLLNNSNPAGPWLSLVETTVTAWLRESPKSLLLVPCISAASRGLASLAHMSAVMEAALEAYFSAGQTPHSIAPSSHGWSDVLSVFQVPQLNQAGYVQEALARDGFLVLFAYLQHQLQMAQSVESDRSGDLDLMKLVLDWTTKAEPNLESDAKLILWWNFLLERAVEQIESFSTQPVVPVTGTVNILVQFIELLAQTGQERSGKGILGAIGFGRSSNISPRVRLLARALSAFLSLRVSSPDKLHLDSSARAFPFSNKLSYGGELVALRRNKAYSHYSEAIENAVAFCQDPSQTVVQVMSLMQRLVRVLFPDKGYLCDVVANI
ncbi:ectopic P granules protein 5 homolog [Elysia marginata]|uniref:Ectopic P granules protein 5 homolog n=1 Tax=Elysia marginata TaxID=1093978 RepID=A0AAV4EMY5_9GAST|nr:ectopic P granules protein 5 homolog [Elysia marginata]